MGHWRAARDKGEGETLSADEQAELETLVEAELRAATDRAVVLAEDRAMNPRSGLFP